MNFNSIRVKILLLLVVVGVVLGLLLAFFAPYQSKTLGTGILQNDAKFISQLLSDNLAIGLETLEFDEGESIKMTLGLIQAEEGQEATISNGRVFDKDLNFVAQLDTTQPETLDREPVEEPQFSHTSDKMTVWMPIRSEGNEVVGHLELVFSKSYLNTQTKQNSSFAIVLALIVLLVLLVPSGFYIHKKAKSIEEMVTVADGISRGDINVALDVESKDEIGALADSFRHLIKYIRTVAQAADSISSGDLTISVDAFSERDVLSNSFVEMLNNLNRMFKDISDQASEVDTTSKGLADISSTMIENADNLTGMSSSVADSSNEMNQNFGVISSNTHDMSTTIEEISRSVDKARTISMTAVQTSESASSLIQDLKQAASEISNVSDVIINISDQTKLLALNATIEAARAGEAGKGFAVVAGEVKDLAFQTNQATEEIRGKMETMKKSTENVVGQIGDIIRIINQVNDFITNIAATVEEQSVTTRNIAENINETADSFGNIASEMNQLLGVSTSVKEASTDVSSNASALDSISSELAAMLKRFTLR